MDYVGGLLSVVEDPTRDAWLGAVTGQPARATGADPAYVFDMIMRALPRDVISEAWLQYTSASEQYWSQPQPASGTWRGYQGPGSLAKCVADCEKAGNPRQQCIDECARIISMPSIPQWWEGVKRDAAWIIAGLILVAIGAWEVIRG